MKLRAIPLFLVGDRDAILTIAASRWALAVGFLLVMAASLARNYDGADLLHESKVLTHGLGASIGNSLILFTIVYLIADANTEKLGRGRMPRFIPGYLSFLGLFWMTAPMGLLYGIPFERVYESPVDAITANLWLLALVSMWRVVLITRVLAVLWNASFAPLLFIVLLFSDVVVFIAAISMPKPLIDFMGGLQHSEEDHLILGIMSLVIFWSVVAFPVLAIGALIAAKKFQPSWTSLDEYRSKGHPCACLALAIAVIGFWFVPMAITQPEQQNRRQAELLLRSSEVEHAIAFMSRRERTDFPPVWDPPPRLGYGERVPAMPDVARALHDPNVTEWVRVLYMPKLKRFAKSRPHYGYRTFAQALDAARWTVIESPSPDPRMIKHLRDQELSLRSVLSWDATLSHEERSAVEGLLSIIENLPPEEDDPAQ